MADQFSGTSVSGAVAHPRRWMTGRANGAMPLSSSGPPARLAGAGYARDEVKDGTTMASPEQDVPALSGAQGERVVFNPVGELDDEVALREQLQSVIGDFSRPVTIDLSDVTFLPSLSVGVLVDVLRAARASGSEVELVADQGTIAHRILLITGLPHTSH